MQYEEFLIVPEKSKDPKVARLLCSHERFGLQAIGMRCVNTVSSVSYIAAGVGHKKACPCTTRLVWEGRHVLSSLNR